MGLMSRDSGLGLLPRCLGSVLAAALGDLFGLPSPRDGVWVVRLVYGGWLPRGPNRSYQASKKARPRTAPASLVPRAQNKCHDQPKFSSREVACLW